MEVWDILLRTIFINSSSSLIAMIIGSILGFNLYFANKHIQIICSNLNRTLMAMPPVVLGLILFLLFKRNGILGDFEILFTPTILIIAQVVLLTPLVCAHTYELLQSKAQKLMYVLEMYQVSRFKKYQMMFYEYKNELIFIGILTLSRAISEVGAVMIVGGNIKGYTRIMTTAIANNKSQGDYTNSIIMGIILLVVAFLIQFISRFFERKQEYENF